MPTMLAYIFAGQVVPASVNDRLQSHIRGILDVIEADVPLLDYLFMPMPTRSQVARVLRQWQQWTAAGYCTTQAIRKNVAIALTVMRENRPGFGGPTGTLPTVELSHDMFERTQSELGNWGS